MAGGDTLASVNVWAALYDEEAAQKAQNLLAAAFGADKDPQVLVSELGHVTEWMMPLKPNGEVDGDKAAQRTLHFFSALTMFGRMGLDAYATAIVEAKLDLKEGVEAPEEDVRNLAFDLLSEYAEHLRQLAGEA